MFRASGLTGPWTVGVEILHYATLNVMNELITAFSVKPVSGSIYKVDGVSGATAIMSATQFLGRDVAGRRSCGPRQ